MFKAAYASFVADFPPRNVKGACVEVEKSIELMSAAEIAGV